MLGLRSSLRVTSLSSVLQPGVSGPRKRSRSVHMPLILPPATAAVSASFAASGSKRELPLGSAGPDRCLLDFGSLLMGSFSCPRNSHTLPLKDVDSTT